MDVISQYSSLDSSISNNEENKSSSSGSERIKEPSEDSLKMKTADDFKRIFNTRIMRMGKFIEAAGNYFIKPYSGDYDVNVLFNEIRKKLKSLQEFVNRSKKLLNEREFEQYQLTMEDLRNNCDQNQSRYVLLKPSSLKSKKIENVTPETDSLLVQKKLTPKNEYKGFSIFDKTDMYIRLGSENINDKDLLLSKIRNCFIEIQGHLGSLQLFSISDCIILCGPVARTVYGQNVFNSMLCLTCQQLRLHYCESIYLFMYVTHLACIVDCKDIDIAGYAYTYPNLAKDFEMSRLEKVRHNFTDLKHFYWLSKDDPSPNWNLIQEVYLPDWNDMLREFQTELGIAGCKRKLCQIK